MTGNNIFAKFNCIKLTCGYNVIYYLPGTKYLNVLDRPIIRVPLSRI